MFWQASDDSFRRRMSWYDCIQQAFYCTKNVQIRSFSWSVFPVFGLNTEIYEVFYEFSPNTGKYRPEKTPYLYTFHAVSSIKDLQRIHDLKHTFPSAYRTAALKKQYQEKHLVCSSNISGIAHVFIKKNSTSRIYKGIFPLSFRKHI